ncbi:YiiX/YebB-like N1pC/P60 family cysteine hydrolase [Amphritea sp. HPY]|uniref:YiiX/YebB-like N1pC/P60 family cysteine hydrolase n=1 Tax=Amphritea sp. HPY TaxID=3421652 RepID=UPI003D7DED1E
MKKQQLDTLEQQVGASLKEGDVLFISIDAFLYKQVARGTGSWSSHVGFAIKEQNQWLVVESKVPFVTKTPLRKFLSRTCNNEVMVRRLKQAPTDAEIQKLKTAAEKRIGAIYHLGFKYNSDRQFCSKFVHQVFKEAIGVELGKIQTLEQLLEENPQASVGFWRCWYFGFIPWQRKTLTPASQIADPTLNTILSTL